MTTTPDAPLATCPTCGAVIAPDDGFCESCGAVLRGDAVAAPADAPPAATPGGTQVVAAPDAPGNGGNGGNGATSVALGTMPELPGRRICAVCGGEVVEDGFCGTCGARAASRRDHWTESPAADLAGVCDKGIAHARNEDAMALAAPPDAAGDAPSGDRRRVVVVCDGVTTAPESDRASLAASRAAARALEGAPPAPADVAGAVSHWTEQLRLASVSANGAAVGIAHALGNPKEPPSCTFVAAVTVRVAAIAGAATSTLVAVAWCGDSRAYWFGDDGAARQVTTDHSLGTEMIRAGATAADAEATPTSHTITRWLGADSVDATPEYASFVPDAPGWLVVCSDGMWNYASSPDALALVMLRAASDLAGSVTPLGIAEAMAAWANDAGGHDNVTVAVARIEVATSDPAFPASAT